MFGENSDVVGHPHVGIASLATFLQKKGFQVAAYDDGITQNKQDLPKIIRNFSPDIIGITSFSYCHQNTLNLLNRIYQYRNNTPIVIGGPHVSAIKSQILIENPKINFAIKSEGEHALLELIETLGQDKPNYKKIKNLIWRNNNKIIENHDRSYIKNIDLLPFPDYKIFDLTKYLCYSIKTIPILTSRGCPYGCNYCSVKLSMGRGFRPRSPNNVISEIKYWYKKGFNNFDINDDCFTLDLKRAEAIADLIIKNNLKITFQLYNGIRVDRISLRLLKKLKKSGCTFIAYGCESGNQEVINTIGKNITLKQVRQAVSWSNEVGIKNAVNFIIGHQNETYEQALDTLKFAQKLPTNFVNFYNLIPYPGTDVYQWAINNTNFLLSKKNYLEAVSYRNNSPIFETSEFTKEEKEEIIKKGFEIYEKKILKHKLGVIGLLIFFLTRFKIIHLFSQKAFSNKTIWSIYNFISNKIVNG